MGREVRNGRKLVRAYANFFAAVAPVLRREDQLLREGVVVALGPAIIALRFEKQQLFGRQGGFLVGREQVGPIGVQLVAAVLSDKDVTACVAGKTFAVAD